MPVSSRTSSDRLTTNAENERGWKRYHTIRNFVESRRLPPPPNLLALRREIQSGNPAAPATSAATSPNGSTPVPQRNLARARRLAAIATDERADSRVNSACHSIHNPRGYRAHPPRLSTRNHARFPPWPVDPPTSAHQLPRYNFTPPPRSRRPARLSPRMAPPDRRTSRHRRLHRHARHCSTISARSAPTLSPPYARSSASASAKSNSTVRRFSKRSNNSIPAPASLQINQNSKKPRRRR